MTIWESITNNLRKRKGEFSGTSGNEADISKRLEKGKNVSISNPTSYRTYQNVGQGTLDEDDIDVGLTSGKGAELASTAISNIDYDPKKEVASVTFQGGKKAYDYKVSPEEMKEMMNAPSKGQWLNEIWKYNNRMPGY